MLHRQLIFLCHKRNYPQLKSLQHCYFGRHPTQDYFHLVHKFVWALPRATQTGCASFLFTTQQSTSLTSETNPLILYRREVALQKHGRSERASLLFHKVLAFFFFEIIFLFPNSLLSFF